MMKLLFFSAFFITSCNGVSYKLDLFGDWHVAGSDRENSFQTHVPGGIYTDLMNEGVLDNVLAGYNDGSYRWVALENWTYSFTFDYVDDELLNNTNVKIFFEGVDSLATIIINGVIIGTTDNMFGRYIYEVKDLLRSTDSNVIEVIFDSPVHIASNLASAEAYKIPPDCPDEEVQVAFCHANQVRKMQSSFGSTYGPAFPSMGLWGDLYMVSFSTALPMYVLTDTRKSPNGWFLDIITYFDGGEAQVARGQIEVRFYLDVYQAIVYTADVNETPNENDEIVFRTTMELLESDVKTWWPNGYGDPNLYRMTVTLKNEIEDSFDVEVYVGFRTVELVQDDLEAGGATFYLKVNDVPIFAKGANAVPLEILPDVDQSPLHIQAIVDAAGEANMNMLRVWGGGVYESDYFYYNCDANGILVWQDFMFESAMYPARPEFLENVRREVEHQVKRLGNHPSVVIWSGNSKSELNLAIDKYGTSENIQQYKNDYINLYVDTIKAELQRIVPNAIFVTSSPSNGKQSELEGYISENPQDEMYGDVHYFNYNQDYSNTSLYPIPRFASQYGIQSMPSVDTWNYITDDVADMNPNDKFVQHREHHMDGLDQIRRQVQYQLPLLDESQDNYTRAFIFYSQIVQAMSVKTQTEHYRSYARRLDEDGRGYTMGALYWHLNDVWVAPSWSSLDYAGSWKMLHYFAKQFFDTNLITGRYGKVADVLDVYVVSETRSFTANVEIHGHRWNTFGTAFRRQYPGVDIQQGLARKGATLELQPDMVGPCGETYEIAVANCFFSLHFMDADDNEVAPINYFFPIPFNRANIETGNIQITAVTQTDDVAMQFDITLTTDTVVVFVWLDAHDLGGKFLENGFLMDSPTKTLQFLGFVQYALSEQAIRDGVTVTHLMDSNYFS